MGRNLIKNGVFAFVILLITAYAFAPMLGSGFVQWDDEQNFLTNFHYRGLGLSQLMWAFQARQIGVYQPLAWLFFGAQYQVWHLSPYGYHLVSLFFHMINSVMVFFLSQALIRRMPLSPQIAPSARWIRAGSAIGALLFAIHPLRVEVVAWASCQPYLPCAFFSMLSWLFFLKVIDKSQTKRSLWYGLLLFCALCAMLCKAIAVTIPLQLICLELIVLPRERWNLRRIVFGSGKLPFYFLASAISVVTVWARLGIEQSAYAIYPPFFERLSQAFYGLALYMQKTIYPVELSPIYAKPESLTPANPIVFGSIVAVVLSVWLLWRLRHRFPAAGLMALCSFLILLPNLGFTQISSAVAADRYTYMAWIGPSVIFAVAWAAMARWKKGKRSLLLSGSFIIIAILVPLSRAQSRIWIDSVSLWQHALAHGGDDQEIVHNNLGMAFFQTQRWDEAATEFSKAIQLKPRYALAHANLGALLLKKNKYHEAAVEFSEALRWNPRSYQSLMGLAVITFVTGSSSDASVCVDEVLRAFPADAVALELMARIHVKNRDVVSAQNTIIQALAASPQNAALYNTQGLILLLGGKIDEAARSFERALALDNPPDEVYLNLADTRMEQGRIEEAILNLREAARRTPTSRDVCERLVYALNAKGRATEGETESRRCRALPSL